MTSRHVLIITDNHIFEDASKTHIQMDTKVSFQAVLRTALDSVVQWDLIVLAGDLAENAEPQSYAWLREQLRHCPVPAVAIPGNHDDVAEMQKYFPPTNDLTLGAWQLVFLDSSIDGQMSGGFSDADLQAFDAQLRQRKSDHRCVFLHHQPVNIGSSWMDGMGLETKAAFWSVIDANDGVEAVLWGHVHQNFDSYRDATRLIATPSTCSQFLPMTERFALDKKRPAYRHLELFDDGKIKSHVVRVSI